MLSFGVKIAWFVLSLTGLLCSTIVLWAFGSALGTRWGPMLFCFGNVLVQGMFCLGMIYRMDPFSMPRSFCLVQSILISFGADLLAGVTLAFSIATYLAVLKPKTWSDGPRALQWRNVYALPVVAVPILAATAQSVVVLKIDTFHPMDGMHCDSTGPLWPRMLGYAGIPILISLPSLYLSTMSILQIRKTNKHLQRARPDSFTDFKKSGPRISRTRTRNISFMQHDNDITSKRDHAVAISPPLPPPTTTITSTASTSPATAPATVRQYHLPFRPPSFHSVEERSKSNLSGRIETLSDRDDASSRVSVTFPTFVNPPLPAAVTSRDQAHQVDGTMREQKNVNGTKWQGDNHNHINMEVIRVSVNGSVMVDADTMDHNDSGEWTMEDKADDLDLGSESGDLHDVYALYKTESSGMGNHRRSRSQSLSPSPYRKPRKEFPTLSPNIWWIILFQFAYLIIPILSSLSTLIDIVTKENRRPTLFGTQHVALLLAAWGPAFVFGHLPIVRSYLLPGCYTS